MAERIFLIGQSDEDDDARPNMVTYYDPDGKFKTEEGFREYQKNLFVSAGENGFPPELWFIPDLFASTPGRTPIDDWDYYWCSGSFGAFSPRAIGVLAPYFRGRFQTLPARLEGHEYYCLCCRCRVDCLDRTASEIVFSDSVKFKYALRINKYAFRKELLTEPMIFAVPELLFHLFCTESVVETVASSGLRGFDFQLLDERLGVGRGQ